MENRITPSLITTLHPNEIFVFGSNIQGCHAGGAAAIAVKKFGAIMGQGIGLQGQSYAIPTMEGDLSQIGCYIKDFIAFAKSNPSYQFLVTPIGCGIAGYTPQEIAPFFKDCIDLENVSLPLDFWKLLVE